MREDDPDILVDLTVEPTAFQAEITRGALVAAGIPAFAATTIGSMLTWDISSSMPIRVQVRRRDLENARRELSLLKTESASIDWEAEDIGVADEGDLAATQPGDPDWAEHREDRRTVAQTMIWLACLPAFGFLAILAFLAGGIARLVRKPAPDERLPQKERR